MSDHDVTLAEVRTEMRAIRESMQKMSDALDRLTRIEVQNQSRDEKIDGLRKDVAELNRRVWTASGAVAVLAVFIQPLLKKLGF
jgi:septation ring formation regulator EzrA